MDDFNPYRPPEASISPQPMASEPGEGLAVWREGTTLVMAKDASLPRRCVKCNAPATFLLKRTISRFHPTLLALLLLPGLGPILLFIVVVMITRTSKYALLPLCDRHRGQRFRNIVMAWVVALVGLALLFAPMVDRDFAFLTWVGLVTLFLGWIFGAVKAQVLPLLKSTPTHTWLGNVAPAYLDALPRLPSGNRPPDFEF